MEKYMDEKTILDTFKMLARSQGFYGRLLHALDTCDKDTYNEFMEDLISQKFTDTLDLILYIEQ